MTTFSLVSASEVSLLNTNNKNYGWTFNNGPEFKGAVVRFEAKEENGVATIYLRGDFKGGGKYVNADYKVDSLEAEYLEMDLLTRNDFITFRIIDSNAVTHQIKYKITRSDGWQRVKFPIGAFFENLAKGSSLLGVIDYQSWGGNADSNKNNNRQFSGKVNAISFILARSGAVGNHDNPSNKDSQANQSFLGLRNVKLILPDLRYQNSTTFNFNNDQSLKEWTLSGSVIRSSDHKNALQLSRTLEKRNTATSAISKLIPVTPGKWDVTASLKSKLESQDNSYRGQLAAVFYDTKGREVDRIELATITSRSDWFSTKKSFTVPLGVSDVRLVVSMEKAWGTFWIKDVELKLVEAATEENDDISKVSLNTPVVGNIFYPNDTPFMEVEVVSSASLDKSQMNVEYVIRDYWGNNLGTPQRVQLEKRFFSKTLVEKKYTATLDLNAFALDIGKYYEVHVSIPKIGGGYWQEYSGIAVLPEAPSKQFKPTDIPFTIRNWDSRIPVYFDLADRIGIRIAGVWGRFNPRFPYNPELPGLDKIKKYDMGIATGTPGAAIERKGWEGQTPKKMAKGMTAWLNRFYDEDRYLQISLGNEPHGTGKTVKDNVLAYKTLYRAIKKFDNKITVIGTSVNANEEYFKQGFQDYLDAYDFHVYGSHKDVRRVLKEYRELAIKYHALKPIVSTELGLNSQGQPRLTVASLLVRSVTSFFAEGGANVSWFTIQYPDANGTARGSSGAAHNVFDCKYNQCNPKMDAVTYYHMVNLLLDKKFIAEKHYGDIENFVFKDKDNNCLQVIWKNEGIQNVFIPMKGVGEVELTAVDGTKSMLNAQGKGLNLTLTNEPLLLSYVSKSPVLAENVDLAEFSFDNLQVVELGAKVNLVVKGNAQSLDANLPFGWGLSRNGHNFSVGIPADSNAREGRLTLKNENTYMFSRFVVENEY